MSQLANRLELGDLLLRGTRADSERLEMVIDPGAGAQERRARQHGDGSTLSYMAVKTRYPGSVEPEAITQTSCDELVVDDPWPTLSAIPDTVIRDRFKATGVLLLRGFGAHVTEFDALARRFSIDFMPGAGRSSFPDFRFVHLVNESMDALQPHTDHGTRPEEHRPSITWMMCEQPADADGETTVFDGVAIWNALSESTRDALRTQRLTFSTRYPPVAWGAMGFHDVAAFRTFASSIGAKLTELGADGMVEIDVSCGAHRKTAYGGQDAFVSSLSVAGSKGFEQLVVRFEDGTPIADTMRTELQTTIAAVCTTISWRAGDYAMLDNTRILHGRRTYRDPRRRIHLLQTHRPNF